MPSGITMKYREASSGCPGPSRTRGESHCDRGAREEERVEAAAGGRERLHAPIRPRLAPSGHGPDEAGVEETPVHRREPPRLSPREDRREAPRREVETHVPEALVGRLPAARVEARHVHGPPERPQALLALEVVIDVEVAHHELAERAISRRADA